MSRSERRIESSRRIPHTLSIRFHLMLAWGLLLGSCVPANVSPTATQSVAATQTRGPVITSSPESLPETIPSAVIDTRMSTLVERIPLAGIALGIDFKDTVYEKGYGVADLDSAEPVTAQTTFKIASLTKSVTAAAILRLAEEGKLSLDDPLSRFFPDTPSVAKDIRVRHLLNHTSGLPEMEIDKAQKSLPDSFTTGQVVEYYFSTIEKLDFAPGEAWSYNNAGYFLLGGIIENVSGMSYDQYFRTAFFEPLGLHSTYACPARPDVLPVGYRARDGQLRRALPSNLQLAAAAGALCSNIDDLVRWLDALSHGKVIRQESWQQMITPARLPDGTTLEYGFGLAVAENAKGPVIMHEGATAGFNSVFVYYPEHDLSIVLLANADGFDPSPRLIASMIADLVLQAP